MLRFITIVHIPLYQHNYDFDYVRNSFQFIQSYIYSIAVDNTVIHTKNSVI